MTDRHRASFVRWCMFHRTLVAGLLTMGGCNASVPASLPHQPRRPQTTSVSKDAPTIETPAPARDGSSLPDPPLDVPSDQMKAFSEVIRSVRSILPLEGRSVEEVRTLNPKKLTLRATGFGATVVRGLLPGRLGNAMFAVVGHEGVVVSATITLSLHASTPDSVRAWAARALGSEFVGTDDGKLVLSWSDTDRMQRMHAARQRVLGPSPSVRVAADLTEAYAHLVSELGGEIGSACGAAASPTQTHRMFRTIDETDDLDVLRSIMRGPNPEGRIYAARSLARRATDGSVQLTEQDEAAYAALSALSIPIRSCSGCSVRETELSADLLAGAVRPPEAGLEHD